MVFRVSVQLSLIIPWRGAGGHFSLHSLAIKMPSKTKTHQFLAHINFGILAVFMVRLLLICLIKKNSKVNTGF